MIERVRKMAEIKITVDENLKVIAGNPYGREMYEKCLKNKFSFDEENILVFPENVRIVCSSFFQGLFSSLLEGHTPDQIYAIVKITPDRLEKNLKQGLFE